MRLEGEGLGLSATDLSNFLGCRHRTALDIAAALSKRTRPRFHDPLFDILIKRGVEHEKSYVDSLRAQEQTIVDLSHIEHRDDLVLQTIEAMRRGVDAIVQGGLRDGRWFGKPDVLCRVLKPSEFGDWSYEIIDTKLSRETRGGTILQLGLYSEMLRLAQSVEPEYFHVVTPDPVAPKHTYRLHDYAAYFRMIRSQMLEAVAMEPGALAEANYPEPVEHCEVCGWSRQCDEKRHEDDHLSLVFGISRLQRRELESRDVRTLAQLARLPLPIAFKPNRGSVETYVRVREQARLQLDSRGRIPPLHELRGIVEGEGLCRLPEPSPGDLFLDLEGDPFAAEGGREYLFGVVTLDEQGNPHYRSFWGFSEQEERRSFEAVIDLIERASEKHPTMHVYHYAPYEPSAFKRLMGRYATRERELDQMLRSARFVDLYAVVRQGVIVGTERYSIKNLEPLYDFERSVALIDANRCLRVMEQALELNCPQTVPIEIRDSIEGYNKDDCVSTLRLRDWLERIRSEHIATGTLVPRPTPAEAQAEELSERAQRVATLRGQLLDGVPEERLDRNEEQQARWLLAYLLDYHRREDKAVWWEYFRLRELTEEELLDEPQAIAGMTLEKRVGFKTNARTGKPTGTVTDQYHFPVQEMEIDAGDVKMKDGTALGKLIAVDRLKRTVDVQKGPKLAEHHPTSVFAHTYVSTAVQEDSIFGIAQRVVDDGILRLGEFSPDKAARGLLAGVSPRLTSGPFEAKRGEGMLQYLDRAVLSLDRCVLPVQGPPGSGKTYAGAQMICALVEQGKRVGITANSHKVIRNLLDAAGQAAKKAGLSVIVAHKGDEGDYSADASQIAMLAKNEDALEAVQSTGANVVVGGTSWLWARPEFADALDVLFVDEAGQMSLANVLAVSPAAKSLVLLGDPRQLEQPKKGSHPDGVSASALQHILQEQKTIPPDRGVFLPTTWRLCPALSAFTSELFYDNRLASKPGLERQRLDGTGQFAGSGLWVMAADHDGNRNSSIEEIDLIVELVRQLTSPGATWTDEKGNHAQLLGKDILIVSPYNAQVARLTDRLEGTGARVGTVDKFQGQEAPIVIYSTATSRPEDAPRGMEFLYSLNRLNVATSRARCAAIIVASPRLFEPECRSPRQMKLANALCRYREMAKQVGPSLLSTG